MKEIRTTEAVGHVLCHDLTRIVRGESKDAAFRKGHVVREEDIALLLSMGKDSLFVWEPQPDMVHENDAAQVLYRLCAGEHMSPTQVKEGKIEVIAARDGLFLADVERLRKLNELGELMIATRHSATPVRAGDRLAGTRIIPLLISREKLAAAQEIGGTHPLLSLLPFLPKKAAILTTGNEVYHGRIADTFTPVVAEKLTEYGAQIIHTQILPDEPAQVTTAIHAAIEEGAQLVLCTGGMSVDPDDRTPLAIRNSGAEVVGYGAPVLPGAMFMLAYYAGEIPIVGLPGCVMYAARTIFDLILPKLMADVMVTGQDIAALGHGGLCLHCSPCTFPNCGFGKGR